MLKFFKSGLSKDERAQANAETIATIVIPGISIYIAWPFISGVFTLIIN